MADELITSWIVTRILRNADTGEVVDVLDIPVAEDMIAGCLGFDRDVYASWSKEQRLHARDLLIEGKTAAEATAAVTVN